ncbi:hypothetical protein BKA64DRAFT_121207 [Cadophora sp. MPI-SDFR-AT-0126]|nr:hypothetical protein BKA64DRAFT_121207 [Leotiomycetes sp. MPI-SDFR-AT-0126]
MFSCNKRRVRTEDVDRKRVLNVLAQRRYRQRQRNRLAELEKKADLDSARSDGQDSKSMSPESDNHGSSSNNQLPEVIGNASLTRLENTENGSQWPSTTVMYPWTSAPKESMPASQWVDGDPQMPPNCDDGEGSNSTMELPDLESSELQFPDGAKLEVPELNVVHAIHAIAVLLQCEDTIRNIKSIRTFTSTTCPLGAPLPATFLPTHEQKRIPHHPVLDLLPWPAVRSKLIRVFNRSPNIRPPVARDPLAVMTLLKDMETPREGLRVNGRDGFEMENWEVGQSFFANWWWALECEVVERSSALRVLRGKESLFVEG